jgi:hypothetical protein
MSFDPNSMPQPTSGEAGSSGFPLWNEQLGLKLGPQFDPINVPPVMVVRDPWISPDNPKVLSNAPFQNPVNDTLTSLATQVFQVIPSAYYDTALVSVRRKTGVSIVAGNRLFGYYGKSASIVGVQTVAALPSRVPDFVTDLFLDYQFFRIEVPFGTMPFYLHMNGSVDTAFDLSVTLMTLGF